MNKLRYLVVSAFVTLCCLSFPANANAQVGFGVQIGAEPACPYGYFDYAPYECAPYGYYGPEWFSNGAFIGAGPWYHRNDRFRGHVDRRYDPRSGYRGSLPRNGERPDWDHHHGTVEGFRGRDLHEENPRYDNGARNYRGDANGGNYDRRGNNNRDGNYNRDGNNDRGGRNNNRGSGDDDRGEHDRH